MGFEIMGCRKHIEQHYVHGKVSTRLINTEKFNLAFDY